jgi:hypothetical protein
MADEKNNYEADRFAAGTGLTDQTDADMNPHDLKPGVEGRGATYLPGTGDGNDRAGSAASSAEGTVGAVGEMDFLGNPAGSTAAGGASGGSASGETRGGGTGGGAASSGGTGPGDAR